MTTRAGEREAIRHDGRVSVEGGIRFEVHMHDRHRGVQVDMKTLRLRGLWLLLRDSAIAWDNDNIAEQGAALSFFTVFSLSPLIILVVVLSSIIFGPDAASGQLVSQIRGLVGVEGAHFVQTLITDAYASGATVFSAILSIVMLLMGASAVFIQLRDSLNGIWRVQRKPTGTIRAFLQSRLFSFSMILAIGFLLLVSLVVSALLAAMSGYMGNLVQRYTSMVRVIDIVTSFIGITVVFALIFKFVPAAVVHWRDVWVGAVVTSLLFGIGKLLIGLYLGNGAIGATFGAASSLVAIMMWVFYSSQIVLFGAEFTRLFAQQYGSKIMPSADGVRVITRTVDAVHTHRGDHRPRPAGTATGVKKA